MLRIDLNEKLAAIPRPWDPHIIGEVNDVEIRLAKLEGEFVWHAHPVEDELFLVVEGELTMHFRDRDEVLGPGQMIIVPHGVEHCPESKDGCSVFLVEPKGTRNTGEEVNERTVHQLKRI